MILESLGPPTSAHRLKVRVYYEDTDFSGFVYHASYLRFFERARTEFLRTLGFEQSQLRVASGAPIFFVVRRMSIEFLRPARMDDVLAIETSVLDLRSASVRLLQNAAGQERLCASCEVLLAMTTEGKARRIPTELRIALENAGTGDASPGVGEEARP